jgi:hypothetical protein
MTVVPVPLYAWYAGLQKRWRCIMADTPIPGVPLPPPGNDLPDTVTAYDDSATQFLAALKAAAAIIPAFEPKHPDTVKFVKKYSAFSDNLITSAIAAVEDSPELVATKKFDLQRAKATVQFMAAYRSPIDAVYELASNMKFTFEAWRAVAIADALQTYAIAKGIGRDPSSANVAAHAANMKRDLRRTPLKKKKKGGKKTQVPAAPTPAPPVQAAEPTTK